MDILCITIRAAHTGSILALAWGGTISRSSTFTCPPPSFLRTVAELLHFLKEKTLFSLLLYHEEETMGIRRTQSTNTIDLPDMCCGCLAPKCWLREFLSQGLHYTQGYSFLIYLHLFY